MTGAEHEAERAADEAKAATEALKAATADLTRQRALVDETVHALAAAEKCLNELKHSLNQTTAEVEKLCHQLELQTKQSEEAGVKVGVLCVCACVLTRSI